MQFGQIIRYRSTANAVRLNNAGTRSRATVRAASTRVVYASSTLKQIIEDKEEQLRDMLQPGKIPPKASVVAAIRKEILGLQKQMDSGLTNSLPSALIADLPAGKTALPARKTIASKGTATSAAASSAPSGARGALLLVEQQLSVATGDASSVLLAVEQGLSMDVAGFNSSELAELEALKAENARLRADLDVLLARKLQLETLKQQHLSSISSSSEEAAPAKKVRKPRKAAAPKLNEDGTEKEKPKRGRKKKVVEETPAVVTSATAAA